MNSAAHNKKVRLPCAQSGCATVRAGFCETQGSDPGYMGSIINCGIDEILMFSVFVKNTEFHPVLIQAAGLVIFNQVSSPKGGKGK